jgi:hypothetical protein
MPDDFEETFSVLMTRFDLQIKRSKAYNPQAGFTCHIWKNVRGARNCT